MPGRKFSGTVDKYRYGFNGKENDDETGTQDYGERIYNSSIGRFFTADPQSFDYPFYTPYQFAGNDVIEAVDVDGLEPGYQKGNGMYVTARDGALQKPMSLEQQQYHQAKGFHPDNGRGTSLGLDLIPGIGTAKGWIEAATGKDLINGEKIPTWVRWASIIPYGKFIGKGKLLLKNSDALLKAAGYSVKVVAKLPCGCFTEQTQIATARGFKEIKDIAIGDSVWSYNELAKGLELRKVINTLQVTRDSLYFIHFNNHILEATSDHPFYIAGRWVEVNKLKTGDSLTLFDNSKAIITAIKVNRGNFTAYNFEVEGLHNYYVTNSKILVHNGICDVVYNGFYKIVKDNKIIYVGKGAEKRAGTSLGEKAGEAASWIQVSEGVAGRSIDETAFIYEYLLTNDAIKEGSKLANKIASPGKKYFEALTKEAQEVFEKTYDAIKTETTKVIEKK